MAAAVTNAANANETCAVCLDEIVRRDGIASIDLGCGHPLHLHCYNAMRNNAVGRAAVKCPMCRKQPNWKGKQEDPVDPPLPATHDYSKIFDMDIVPGFSEREGAKVPFVVKLTAGPDPNENEERSAVDLVLTIDRSYSMVGTKLDLVKETLKTIFTLKNGILTPRDRVSIVTFDDEAVQLCPLTRASKESFFLKLVDSIQVGGGTNITKGMKASLKALGSRKQHNPCSSILFLSDGQDLECNTLSTSELLGHAKTLGSSVYTFGYGTDHDPQVLSKLVSNGAFTYIEDLSQVREVMVSAVGSIKSTAIQKLKGTITLSPGAVEQGIKFVKNQGNTVLDSQIGFEMADINYGQTKDVLLWIEVPLDPDGKLRSRHRHLFNSQVSFTVLDTQEQRSLPGHYNLPSSRRSFEPNFTIATAILKEKLLQALETATSTFKEEPLDAFSKLLETYKATFGPQADSFVKAWEDEVKQAKEQVKEGNTASLLSAMTSARFSKTVSPSMASSALYMTSKSVMYIRRTEGA